MYKVFFALLKIVPMPILSLLAQFVGWLLCVFKNSSLYRTTNINIMLVRPQLSDSQRQLLVKKSIANQLFSTMASAKAWVMPTDFAIQQIIKVHNQDILTNAFNSNQGVLAVLPHLGIWEVLNPWLSRFNDTVILYKPFNNPAIDKIIKQGRQRLNATLVPTNNTGVKALLTTLKQGGLSIILPDHVPSSGGVIVPFFDMPTLTGTLVPKLANKTGCALVGLACIKESDGFHIYCYEMNDSQLYAKDINTATTALNHKMSQMIDWHFEHYMWGYRRFKYTPIADNLYLLNFQEIYQKRQAIKTQ